MELRAQEEVRRLRLAVIGAGSWAVGVHLPALAARPEVEFVGVCRQDGAVLDRIKSNFGFAVASEDYRDVLALEPDIVVVASPSSYHHEHAKAALLSGAHVLCEKPMTVASEQAWDLVDTAERMDRQLLLSFGWDYMPIVRRAADLVTTTGIGELEHVTIHMSSATRELLSNSGAYPDASPEYVPDSETWTNASVSGGGYGQAQLSHALGLVLKLVPERVESVFALTSAPLGAPVELHDAATLRFSGGGIGVLSGGSQHVGAWNNKHQLEVRAIGSEGQFIVDVHRELVWVFRPDGTEVTLDFEPGAGAYESQGPANALVDAALGIPGANCAPGELGARTVEALELLYRSAATGMPASR